MTTSLCESCGMPVKSGRFCHYCCDEAGNLQPFDVRFHQMVEWTLKRADTHDRAEAERRTLSYLMTMPAWKNDPTIDRAGVMGAGIN